MSYSLQQCAKAIQKRINTARLSLLMPFAFLVCFFLATYALVSYFINFGNYERTQNIYPEFIMRLTPKSSNEKFHVAVTTTEGVYCQWQTSVMYYYYKKAKDKAGSNMGKFTRILHSGKADSLMDEIPSFVVDPLPEGVDRGYTPLNRPWAYLQWLQSATIEEEYILMCEPDHIIAKPIPNLAFEGNPVGFPFVYMEPTKHETVIRKYYPEGMGPVSNIGPIGNSPVIIKKSLIEEIAPTWVNVSLAMKNDTEAEEEFGWVLEMYSYAVAAALHGVKHDLRKDFMVEPPWDEEVGKAFIVHYTYGCEYNMKGELQYGKAGEWGFDKRSYVSRPPPRNLSLPPPGVPESVVKLVEMINEASGNIPNWDDLK